MLLLIESMRKDFASSKQLSFVFIVICLALHFTSNEFIYYNARDLVTSL